MTLTEEQIAEIRARVEAATQPFAMTNGDYLKALEDRETLLSALEAANKRVAELEGALRPFADKAAKWEANHPIRVGSREHSHSTQVTHRLGDFRRARDVLENAALKGASHEQG